MRRVEIYAEAKASAMFVGRDVHIGSFMRCSFVAVMQVSRDLTGLMLRCVPRSWKELLNVC